MELSNFQKEIINRIYEKEFENSEYRFKHMFEDIFSILFENVGINLTETSLSLYGNSPTTKSVQISVNNFCDLYFLIKKLREKEYLFFIPGEESEDSFSFNMRDKTEFSKINLTTEQLRELLTLINSKFYISGKLHDLVKRKYKSPEQLSLIWTQRALWASIVIGLLGIATSVFVSTTIKFDKDVDLSNVKHIEKTELTGDLYIKSIEMTLVK